MYNSYIQLLAERSDMCIIVIYNYLQSEVMCIILTYNYLQSEVICV